MSRSRRSPLQVVLSRLSSAGAARSLPASALLHGIELQRTLRALADSGVRTVAIEVSSHALHQQRVEGVRFAAVESLLRLKNEEVAREALLQVFVSDTEESLRLRIRIAEGFAELGWLVHGYRGGVEKKLPEGFQLDREGHILDRKQSE